MKLFCEILADLVNYFMISLEEKNFKNHHVFEEITRVFQEVLQEPVFIEKSKHHRRGKKKLTN